MLMSRVRKVQEERVWGRVGRLKETEEGWMVVAGSKWKRSSGAEPLADDLDPVRAWF